MARDSRRSKWSLVRSINPLPFLPFHSISFFRRLSAIGTSIEDPKGAPPPSDSKGTGYVDRPSAARGQLIRTYSNRITIGVDSTHAYNPTRSAGRPSVRLENKHSFTRGLYVLSLNHMPYGCGTWPAFWSVGPKWPNNGEIDIIEGVNTAHRNTFALHTARNCKVPGRRELQSGTQKTTDCFVDANYNSGCAVEAPGPFGYGKTLNDNKGGTYVMEWTSRSIRMWFFRKGSEPASIAKGNSPDPAQFGKPLANYQGAGGGGSCDINAHFRDHRIVIDTTFCGDYGGNVYAESGCPMKKGLNGYQSCVDYVARNPGAFKQAYWDINYLKVFQLKQTSAAQGKALSLRPAAAPGKPNAATVNRIAPARSATKDHTEPSAQPESPATLDLIPPSDLRIGGAPDKPTSSEPPCDATHTTSSGTLYHTYCDATVDGSTLKTLQTSTLNHCIAECDALGKSPHPCTGVVYSPSTTCELRHTAWDDQVGVRPGMAMLHSEAGSVTALRLDVQCEGEGSCKASG
ncbi:MAG: hypothetical protein M1831_003678 [Alyxoria varia]|nr:MAG: hypothetical protein M1831_003678 [Alyxoria varia]